MHPDVTYEAFLFSSRHTLDAAQLVSRALRDVVGQSTILPLRYIGCAWLNECSNSHGFINGLTEGDMVADMGGFLRVPNHYPTLATEAGKRDCLRRLNNAFVKRLAVCFACGTFLPYMRERSEDFFCRIRVLSTWCANDQAGAIQHDLAAFVAQKFAPNTYEPQLEKDHGLRSQYALLFDHESLRHNIEFLQFDYIWDDVMEVPTSVLPALFNVSKLKECNIHCASDPTAWINGFIETFEQAVDELRMVTSVTVVLNEGYGDLWGPSSVTHAAPRLVHPAQTELPPPRTAFLDELLADGIYWDEEASRTQSKCELYVFTNALLKKRLHVYRWIVDEEGEASEPSSGRVYQHQVTHIVLADL